MVIASGFICIHAPVEDEATAVRAIFEARKQKRFGDLTQFKPEAIHAALGPDFYDEVQAARFPAQILRFRNQKWAEKIGLAGLEDAEWLRHFARFKPFVGSFPKPLALRYHGHQFRHYNPDLGDGRGFLFAQMRDASGGLLDFGTKGSGETPWSRAGDGRLTLKGGVREVLATQMLEALGVNTSKSFSLIETGEALQRGDEPSPTRSSVLVRLNHSHIRIGTFQRLAALQQPDNIEKLLEHTLRYYMPEISGDNLPDRIGGFLRQVGKNLARTVAQWMAAGFVHGVLNSDNINVTGESFDYGPWRFVPTYDPNFTAAYFDHNGLYAFGRQPSAVGWNFTRLAECFAELAPMAVLNDSLEAYSENLQPELAQAIIRRLGLKSNGFLSDITLTNAWFKALYETKAPFEQAFFDWFGNDTGRAQRSVSAPLYAAESFAPVRAALKDYQPASEESLNHPYFSNASPCTMLIDDVEVLWEPIAQRDDWSRFEAKLAQIEQMAAAYHLT